MARARRYHRPLYAAAVGGLALDLALLAVIAFGPPGAWLSELLEGLPWWGQVVGLTALIAVLTTAVHLPISFWAGFVRERRWGFSTQDLRGFAADRAKALLVGVVLSSAALVGLIGSARLLPRAWPPVAILAGSAVVLALGLLAPLVIEPLFNRFGPLADAELAAELRALAAGAGLPIEEVLVADASRRTRKANAYVSGLGPTRRLVLYDTLLARADRPELGLVLAHELGHRRAHHLIKGALLGIAGLALFVAVLCAALRLPGLRAAIGAPGGAGDPRVVPFVLFLAAVLQLPAAPLGSALSRRWERVADRFSLELTGDLAAFEAAHRLLATANLADLDPPAPVYLAFFSHPTPVERIQAARSLAAQRSLPAPAVGSTRPT